MKTLLLPLLLLGCTTAAIAPPHPGYRDQTVLIASKADFDPARYAGRWYEVARLPAAFQDGCASTLTDYAPPEGDTLRLQTACLGADGRMLRAVTGTARVSGPGRLTVTRPDTAAPTQLWILWADSDYRTAVLGQPDGRGAWILNRGPVIPHDRMRAALTVLDFNGYDTRQLAYAASP